MTELKKENLVERRSTALYWNLWPAGRVPTSASVRSGPTSVALLMTAAV